jgi:hypothetical protein
VANFSYIALTENGRIIQKEMINNGNHNNGRTTMPSMIAAVRNASLKVTLDPSQVFARVKVD